MATNSKRNWRVRGDRLQLRVSLGSDPVTGKRNVYTKTVSDIKEDGKRMTQKERDRVWDDYAFECRNGMVSRDGAVTVETILKDHIRKNFTLSKNTVRGYNAELKRVPEALLKRRAATVKKHDIREWVRWLAEDYRTKSGKPLSAKSIHNSFGFMSAAFQTAVEDDLLVSNPCKDVKLPRDEAKKKPILTLDECRKLVSAVLDLPIEYQDEKVTILLALLCGLRLGEVYGLDESDVDFETRMIDIHQARYAKSGGGMEVAQTKSQTSNRQMEVPSVLVLELKKLRLHHNEEQMKLGSAWHVSPALIKGTFGAPYYARTIYRFFGKLLEENDLPHIGLHALRHSYASLLGKSSVPVADISKLLGHASVGITDRYMHSLLVEENGTASKIQSLIMGNAI